MAVFAKTVEQGSFRAASAELGLAPSVVSHHVARLEEQLGAALLYRSTRRLSLTDEGRLLFDAARSMVDSADRGVNQLVERATSPSGHLTIAAPTSLLAEPIVDDIAAFAEAHPRVSLSLRCSDQQVDILGEGVDVAIRAGTLKDSALRARKLFVFERVLVASAAYARGRPAPRGPGDLAGWDWIQLESRPPEAVFASGERVQYTARVRVNVGLAALGLARGGLGLATVPRATAAHDLQAGRVVEVLPGCPLEALSVHVVWPANAARSSLTLRLIAFLDGRQQRAQRE